MKNLILISDQRKKSDFSTFTHLEEDIRIERLDHREMNQIKGGEGDDDSNKNQDWK